MSRRSLAGTTLRLPTLKSRLISSCLIANELPLLIVGSGSRHFANVVDLHMLRLPVLHRLMKESTDNNICEVIVGNVAGARHTHR